MNHKEKIKQFYTNTSKENLNPVLEFYHTDIDFKDPVGSIKGREKLFKYYKDLYEKAESVKFDFHSMVEEGNTVVAVWKMTFVGSGVLGKDPITVEGNSVITFDEKGLAIYHRDYFDMGEFIYEKIPVLGFLVKQVKGKLEHK